MKYIVSKSFSTTVKRSSRVLAIAEAFGIGLDNKEFVVFDNAEFDIEAGDIVYITGQSGAGKSVLLRELAQQMADAGLSVANIDQVQLTDEPLVDQIGKDTEHALALMASVGINDAFLYGRVPRELSDGQRYRFRLAKIIETGANVWVADEFMAVLDRTTAKVIAFALQKLARQQGAILLIATTHKDLIDDLYPSLYVEKRFREKLRTEVFADALERAQNAPVSKDELYSMLSKGLA